MAIKILEKSRIADASDIARVAREIHILKIIRHPNLIQLYEIIETAKQLYLVTEFATGGELFDYIVAKKRLKEREACKFFQQIVSGVEYLHRIKVVHRDLKPENLLLDRDKNVKIVDFGLSNTYKSGEKLKTACGSPCYAAPEMIAGKKYVGMQVDIWSAGVVLYALVCGYLPFEDPNTANLYKKIMGGTYTMPRFLSAEAKDMIRGILNTDPAKRFTLDDIKRHPWYSLVPAAEHAGIVMGIDKIPIDPDIINQLASYGFNSDHSVRCIESNKHNHITTTYYLLLQKKLLSAPADLSLPARCPNKPDIESPRIPHPPSVPRNADVPPHLKPQGEQEHHPEKPPPQEQENHNVLNLKDILNSSLVGKDPAFKRRVPVPFVLNSRFRKGRRLSINTRILPSAARDSLPTPGPQQNITIIRPQINNVTIIAPGSSKGRAALAKYIQYEYSFGADLSPIGIGSGTEPSRPA